MTTIAQAPGPLQGNLVHADAIPRELRERPQWVCWRYETRKDKRTKMPCQTNGRRAKSDDRTTWTTFGDAHSAYQHDRQFEGIGFVFSNDDDFLGIDLDACHNPETGQLTDWAEKIVKDIASYTEVSPSGYGVKIVACGTLPISNEKSGRAKKLKDVATFGDKNPEIATYDKLRFWCLTGQHLAESPPTCESRQEQITALFDRLYSKNGEPKAKSSRNVSKPSGSLYDRLIADCQTAQNGERSERDFALCAAAHRFNWDKEELWQDVQGIGKFAERGRDYFDTTWQNAEQHADEWQPNLVDLAPVNVVTNAVHTKSEGAANAETFPMTMAQILARTKKQTDSWPRRVDGALFVHDQQHGIGWLEKQANLFGWFATRVGRVKWFGGPACVGRSELFAELQRTAITYSSVESLPHEPMCKDHYYACERIEPGDGKTLRTLLDRFNPAKEIDRDLLLAAFLTPAWGGPCGARPAFVITSDDGRGAGKTTVAKCVGQLWGGLLSFSHNEDINKIKSRLLSPEALLKRVCLLDNVKLLRFSWAELEGMITAPEIGGHRYYVGEGTRPNTLTWFITLNGASLSKDMAQRSVIVKVKKPKRSATWEEETIAFIEANRSALIADCIAALRAKPFSLTQFTRWASWEKDILQRLPEPGEAQRVILERQNVADAEADEADLLEEYFADQLRRLNYDTDTDQVFIPSGIAAKWFNDCHNDKQRTTGVTRIINQAIEEETLKRIRSVGRSYGRGFVWQGNKADPDARMKADINERIAYRAS